MELFEQLLTQVRGMQLPAGQSQTLLITGEAGMGKTRLVSEMQSRAAAHQWQILAGQCTQIEQGLPYAPLLDLLRNTSRHDMPTTSWPLVEQLSTQLALPVSMHQSPTQANPAQNGPTLVEPDKYHLYHLVAQLIDQLTQSAPLLLIIEDLHWSDIATLELLTYLAQRTTAQPRLFLFTFRSEEVSPALSHLLAQLDRTRHSHEVRLVPLSRGEVDVMLRTIFGQSNAVRTPFLDDLYTLTEGNPFFIEESLKSMVMAGDLVVTQSGVWTERPLGESHIPRSVRDAVQQRSERISASARMVLKLAAVAGRHFDFTLLQRLAGLTETELLARLKELIDAQFLEEESADRLVFRHALTRQSVYAAVMARERRQLHATIAAELETLYGAQAEPPIADLAYHSYAGECWAQALKYAQQAGEHALAFFAPQMAVEQFGHAIEAAQQLADPSLARLVRQRGHAHALAGNFDAASQDYTVALEAARARQDHHSEWTLLIDLGLLWNTHNYVRGGAYLDEAYTLAQRLDQPTLVAHSLNARGNWAMNQGHPADAVQSHQQALPILRAASDEQGVAQTLDFLAIASYNCGDIPAGCDHYLAALPMWQALRDRRGLLHTLSGLGLGVDFDLEVNDITTAQHAAWSEAGLAQARELGWQAGLALALICLALTKRHQGHYGTALELLREALAVAQEIEHREWIADAQVAIGNVLLDLLALDEARTYLEAALAQARAINSTIWITYAAIGLATIDAHQGNYAQANAMLDTVLTPNTPKKGLQQRALWFTRAEIALAANQPTVAHEIITQLWATTIHGDAAGKRTMVPRMGLLHSRILLRLERHAEAAEVLDAAIHAAARQQRAHLLWRLHVTQAELCLRQQGIDADRTEQALTIARQMIDDLAASLTTYTTTELPQLSEQFIQRAMATLPTSPKRARAFHVTAFGGTLTPREREVAALVAQGKSNRAIADALVISERTAERHVANIMDKLGYTSRAQVATWYATTEATD